MAEGKNNVIVYRDWLPIIQNLDNEQIGVLMRTFFEYINDLNPDNPKDPLVNMAWSVFKTTLKRDLKKWKQKSDKNRDNAKERWDRIKKLQTDANASERIQTDANDTDSDIDSDSVKDKDSVKDTIYNENSIKLTDFCYVNKITKKDCDKNLDTFLTEQYHLSGDGEGLNRPIDEIYNHFIKWLKKGLREGTAFKTTRTMEQIFQDEIELKKIHKDEN